MHYLSACLNSLTKQTLANYEIFVVDNASEDASCTLIENEYPNTCLLKLTSNLGLVRTNISCVSNQSRGRNSCI
jgi:GT2 family glycosyltransferase